jgi:branched-chain amino acid transport system permease protein
VLIGLGFIAVYNVTGVINLAQGEYAMIGAMVGVVLYGIGLPVAVAFVGATAIAVLIGAGVHRLTIYPARHAPEVSLIMITIGTSIAIRGLALLVWGTTPSSLPDFTPGPPIRLAGAILSRQRLWIMGTAAITLIILYLFFDFTLLGKAVRACSINRQAAELLGIDTNAMAVIAYSIGSGMSAMAGFVIAPLTLVSYNMGLALGLKGFVVAIMGGMVSPLAAVIGGLLLGVLESYASGLVTGGLKEAVAFLVLFIVLLGRTVKITDLLGRRS